MGRIVLIVICLILSGFQVSPLETQMPLRREEQKNVISSRRDGNYFTTTVQGKLRSDMPEFSFDIEACFNMGNSTYKVKSVTVREEEKTLQVISVPELALFGETAVWQDQEESMGLELEDVNFDGYKDIRLFDTMNGNYLLEWIYLVWNPETEQFDHDPKLSQIPLASFNQEEQLIYGMERGGADRHYFFTYQYLDGESVKIREERSAYLGDVDSEVMERCLDGVDVSVEEVEVCHETVWERNPGTGEMERTQDQFIFYVSQADGYNTVMQVEADSQMGEILRGEEG